MLLLFLGKMRTFPRFDLYFHYKQVRVGWKKVDGVDRSLSRLGLLEFVLLKGVIYILSFTGLELQLFQVAWLRGSGEWMCSGPTVLCSQGNEACSGEQIWKFTAEDLSASHVPAGDITYWVVGSSA